MCNLPCRGWGPSGYPGARGGGGAGGGARDLPQRQLHPGGDTQGLRHEAQLQGQEGVRLRHGEKRMFILTVIGIEY